MVTTSTHSFLHLLQPHCRFLSAILLFKRVFVYNMYIYTTLITMYTWRQFILFWTKFVISERKLNCAWMQRWLWLHNFVFKYCKCQSFSLLTETGTLANFISTHLCGFNTTNYFCRQKSGINAGTCETARDAQRAENPSSRRTPCSSLWRRNFSFVETTANARTAQYSMRGTRNALWRKKFCVWRFLEKKIFHLFIQRPQKIFNLFFQTTKNHL